MGESRFLARKKGDQSGSMERRGKGGLHSEGRRFQGGNGGQATRASLGDVEGSMSGRVDAKALQDDLQSLGFTPSLAKSEMGKEVGIRSARS